jgi:hypothetical protein
MMTLPVLGKEILILEKKNEGKRIKLYLKETAKMLLNLTTIHLNLTLTELPIKPKQSSC